MVALEAHQLQTNVTKTAVPAVSYANQICRNQQSGRFEFMLNKIVTGIVFLAVAAVTNPAHAGGSVTFGDSGSVSLGGAVRTGLTLQEGDDAIASSLALQSARLYIGGKLNDTIKWEFNTEYGSCNGTACIYVMDAIAKFEFSDEFNIWAGRFLPPSDRSNLSGPYYGNIWSFPSVQRYPNVSTGRDDGIAVWGKLLDGMLKYQVGAFSGLASSGDIPLFATRLTLNLWDVEGGYYNNGTYYGAQDTLALGAVLMYQPDGLGVDGARGDYMGWNVDFLYEQKLDFGVPTLEAALYNYSASGIAPEAAGMEQGMGFFVLASFLLDGTQGPGTLQPKVRYMQFMADEGGVDTTQIDAGFDYVIEGHNARVSVVYQNTKAGEADASHGALVGLQIQI